MQAIEWLWPCACSSGAPMTPSGKTSWQYASECVLIGPKTHNLTKILLHWWSQLDFYASKRPKRLAMLWAHPAPPAHEAVLPAWALQDLHPPSLCKF